MINIYESENPSIEEKFGIIIFTILIFITLNIIIAMYLSLFLMAIFIIIKGKIIKWNLKLKQ